MAIFTTNRTSLNEDVEHIIADEHCIGDFGATDLITESYYNDQAIFEAVLKRDVLSIVAEQDGSDSAKDKSEKADGNLLQKMWAKIQEMIDKLMAKIEGLAESFYKKMQSFKHTVVSKFLAKRKEAFKKADLSKVKMSGFKMFKMKGVRSYTAEAFASALKDEADLSELSAMIATAGGGEKKKDAEKRVYGNLVGANKEISAADFKKAVHEDIWEKDDTENPFTTSGVKDFVLKTLEDIGTENSEVSLVRKTKKGLKADLAKKKKEAKAELKKAKKAKDEAAIKVAKQASTIVSAVQRVAGTAMSTMMKEEKAIVKACWKLLKVGAKAGEAKEENKEESKNEAFMDPDLLTAFAEAAEFEAEMYLDYNKEIDPVEEAAFDDDDDILGDDASYSFI